MHNKRPKQLFGSIKVGEKELHAMACRDIDTPDEIIFHLWENGPSSPRALRCSLSPAENGLQEATIVNFYKTHNGALVAPPLEEDEIADLRSLKIKLRLDANSCGGQWASANDSGVFTLMRYPSTDRVKAVPVKSWDEFKSWAARARNEYGISLFRGHGDSKFPLGTTFHRTGRQNLISYCDNVLPEFRSHAEVALGMRLNGADNFSTVLALAQHHGLPTPMLDFTTSPYVAAFFAFSDAIENERQDATHVRIFGLTAEALADSTPQSVILTAGIPFIHRLTVSPINNPRLYAQQGQFIVTNLADVENFIVSGERTSGRQALHAIDIPIEQATVALEDLQYMGLTASTMFPGLDGICKMLRHGLLAKTRRSTIKAEQQTSQLESVINQ